MVANVLGMLSRLFARKRLIFVDASEFQPPSNRVVATMFLTSSPVSAGVGSRKTKPLRVVTKVYGGGVKSTNIVVKSLVGRKRCGFRVR